jgi:hypothetical protein
VEDYPAVCIVDRYGYIKSKKGVVSRQLSDPLTQGEMTSLNLIFLVHAETEKKRSD